MREIRPNAIVGMLLLAAIAGGILWRIPSETEALIVCIAGIAWCAKAFASDPPHDPGDRDPGPFPFRGRR